MVSGETGLPAAFDPESGRNVKWTARLGRKTYVSGIIVAGGKVFAGTNNARPRDSRNKGDRGVLMCFDEQKGTFLWQLAVPKLGDDRYKDWPRIGICSPPTVDGEDVYLVTNRAEVVRLDIDGQADGNDGPFTDEGRHMVPAGDDPLSVTNSNADIIWLFDMQHRGGIRPHDGIHSSVLVDGRYLYVNTGNGVDNTHKVIEKPDGPSLVVFDKETGRLVARDGERIGPDIFHCTWSSPSMGTVNGRKLVFFGGGDGVLYAFAALGDTMPAGDEPVTLDTVWQFDCDPDAPKKNVRSYQRNRKVSPSVIYGMPVIHDGRVYVTYGGDIWWGKQAAWIACVDAGGGGDVTETARLWTRPLKLHCCTTPSISDGLVYIADCSGTVYCFDARSGDPAWTHDAGGAVWASTLVADGKVYVGTRRGDFWILAAGREKKVFSKVRLDGPVHDSPAAADGTLYVASMQTLYALRKEAQ